VKQKSIIDRLCEANNMELIRCNESWGGTWGYTTAGSSVGVCGFKTMEKARDSFVKRELGISEETRQEIESLESALRKLSRIGLGPCGGGGALDEYSRGVRDAEERVRKFAKDALKGGES
jgi:hypothetical protein